MTRLEELIQEEEAALQEARVSLAKGLAEHAQVYVSLAMAISGTAGPPVSWPSTSDIDYLRNHVLIHRTKLRTFEAAQLLVGKQAGTPVDYVVDMS